MSDLQDLIHKTSIDCIEKGQRMERERIIKLLEDSLIALPWEGIFWNEETMGKSHRVDVTDLIALIKGETNE